MIVRVLYRNLLNHAIYDDLGSHETFFKYRGIYHLLIMT